MRGLYLIITGWFGIGFAFGIYYFLREQRGHTKNSGELENWLQWFIIVAVGPLPILSRLVQALTSFGKRQRNLEQNQLDQVEPKRSLQPTPKNNIPDIETVLEGVPGPLVEKLFHLSRPSYRPVTTKKKPHTATLNKMGGRPHISADYDWPKCANCGKHLQLLLQLDTQHLPEGGPDLGKGLVQLFYCNSLTPHCELICEAWNPFAKSVLARKVPLNNLFLAGSRTIEDTLPEKWIIDWNKNDHDLPDISEEDLGLDKEELDILSCVPDRPITGDKLWGWPAWIQGVEYPTCPECGKAMSFVFQITSEGELLIMFGDLGIGHLTICEEHPEVMAFGWAC